MFLGTPWMLLHVSWDTLDVTPCFVGHPGCYSMTFQMSHKVLDRIIIELCVFGKDLINMKIWILFTEEQDYWIILILIYSDSQSFKKSYLKKECLARLGS